MFPILKKLNLLVKILKNVNIEKYDDTLVIKTSDTLVFHSDKNILLNSPNGYMVVNGRKTFLNPKMNLKDVENTIQQKKLEAQLMDEEIRVLEDLRCKIEQRNNECRHTRELTN